MRVRFCAPASAVSARAVRALLQCSNSQIRRAHRHWGLEKSHTVGRSWEAVMRIAMERLLGTRGQSMANPHASTRRNCPARPRRTCGRTRRRRSASSPRQHSDHVCRSSAFHCSRLGRICARIRYRYARGSAGAGPRASEVEFKLATSEDVVVTSACRGTQICNKISRARTAHRRG